MACTCPENISCLEEMCEECKQQLHEDAPVPIEVEETIGKLEEGE